MRIWDVDPSKLCNKHLLGLHYEIHAVRGVLLSDNPGGYKNHPEVTRWHGRLLALLDLHEEVAIEMIQREMNHKSPFVCGSKWKETTHGDTKPQPIISIKEQIDLLCERCEDCREEFKGGI